MKTAIKIAPDTYRPSHCIAKTKASAGKNIAPTKRNACEETKDFSRVIRQPLIKLTTDAIAIINPM